MLSLLGHSFFKRFFGRIADSNTVHEKETLEAIKQNANGLQSRSPVYTGIFFDTLMWNH